MLKADIKLLEGFHRCKSRALNFSQSMEKASVWPLKTCQCLHNLKKCIVTWRRFIWCISACTLTRSPCLTWHIGFCRVPSLVYKEGQRLLFGSKHFLILPLSSPHSMGGKDRAFLLTIVLNNLWGRIEFLISWWRCYQVGKPLLFQKNTAVLSSPVTTFRKRSTGFP